MQPKLNTLAVSVLLAFSPWSISQAGLLDSAIPASCNTAAASCIGSFSAPFDEPTINKTVTTEKCIPNSAGVKNCKPAAGTLISLYDGRFLYFDALEGSENVQVSAFAEFAAATVNDQTRVLSLGAGDKPTWIKPSPVDAGANPNGNTPTPLIPGGVLVGQTGANGALFCADITALADGRILAIGGTDYYNEPGIDGLPVGVLELEGLKNARIFNPRNNTWTQTASMNFGRWYPTAVTLANSDVFVASGVTKVVKPIYPESPYQSGRNVVQTETFDVNKAVWTDNGGLAQRSLPLYPRLHLLPNGQVYYNAGGQVFNPFGQSYDQPLWNIVGAYSPTSKSWTDMGYAGFPLRLNEQGASQLSAGLNPTNPLILQTLLKTLVGQTFTSPEQLVTTLGRTLGFAVDRRVVEKTIGSGLRGTTHSIMLPLKVDQNGNYSRAEFLTSGGTLTAFAGTSPGTYLATDSSRIDSVDLSGGGMAYSSRLTGKLNQRRWFSTGVMLPDQSVMVFNGADRDGVILPGLDVATRRAERFDPVTETWKPMATANRMRTYHNTATLMPDGRVLIGGHAPITTAYLSAINLQGLGFSPNDGRDPSFEIYSPPYVSRTDRPVITSTTVAPVNAERGSLFTVTTKEAALIDKVQLIRFTDLTHLIDADQRSVEIPIVARTGNTVQIKLPANAAVLPAGNYMLFISKTAADGTVVPSTSTPVHINAVAR
ncbi:DUF1929 domain-containing protein [Actimicrobium sp. CCC2.4]|uniref:galactose oxidase-like domain-containing protein n=1 Tax=Actimicrobium sp. CCC2.4 TaxID=3048606 RepID=UPI002AC8A9C0|nr:galactose oxidase-like domain-containing protein [Actimicrobium sp. CCC2.4]MEB0137296.1 DUF1929 domain-containing protein [Actimicrobium sp. CCC2.4]WPX32522.1 DUF1929 domain-containing protein [Actimicrobium sp. CCC2.4]